MAKIGTLPFCLYFNKISEVAEITEAYSADMERSYDMEKEAVKRD